MGNTVSAVLAEVFGPQLHLRRQRVEEMVLDAVVILETRISDLEAVLSGDSFISVLADVSRVALGEHLEEKLDMLKAILVNSGLNPPEAVDLLAHRYVRWVDELEPPHVHVLRYASDPLGYIKASGRTPTDYMMAGQMQVLTDAQLPYVGDQLRLILDDLSSRGLGRMSDGTMTGQGAYGPWISERGREFLRWITLM